MRIVPPLLVCVAIGSLASATSIEWTQSGGGLASTPSQSGIVAQGYVSDVSQGGGVRLQSGFLAHRFFHINKPYVVAPIGDRSVAQGFESIRIALSGVFADMDGDTLRFLHRADGTSSNGLISNDTLIVSGVAGASGITTFSVSATDGIDTATIAFKIDVEPSTAIQSRPVPATTITKLDVRVHRPSAAIAGREASEGFLGREDRVPEADRLGIDILLPGPASVAVSIFDNLGTPVISWTENVTVRSLAGIASEPDGRRPVAVTWNLRAPNGQRVAPGVYLWKIVASTPSGEKLETIRRLGVKPN